jgi:hypothetical protein
VGELISCMAFLWCVGMFVAVIVIEHRLSRIQRALERNGNGK